MVLRAKTKELMQIGKRTRRQIDNSALNVAEMESRSTFLQSYPRRVVLELTNACNLKCVMCGRDEARFKLTSFKVEWLDRLKEAYEHAEEVTLFGWGEPTIHPDFERMLEYLDHYPLRKYFVTNGMRLDRLKQAIFDQHVDIVAVSLDGANAATNDGIRVGSSHDKITRSLEDIISEKRRRGLEYPYMNFVFTAMRSNLHEIPDMVRLAHKLGLEEVKVVYLTVFSEHLIHESLWNYQEEVRAVFAEAERLSNELGIKLKLPYIQGEDIAGNGDHKGCFVGWRDFFLGSDGYVRPCQSTAMKLFPIDRYNTFTDMWNSPEYMSFREMINGNDPQECKRCYQSSHASWNRRESFIQVGQMFAPKWEQSSRV
jgi:radical SAM protein with 4Fe4S-binding SPASM domain